jgi:uncharacterized membrane protein YbhN (UPF0104 family)
MKRLAVLGKIAVSLAVITWVLSRIDSSDLLMIMGKADVGLLLLAFLTHGIGFLLSAMRWGILLRIENINVSLKVTVLTCWIGSFFNTFLPSTVGGDVFRTYHVSKQSGKLWETAITVIFERLAGVVALAAIGSLAFTWLYVSPAELSLWKALAIGGIIHWGNHIIPVADKTPRVTKIPVCGWQLIGTLKQSVLRYRNRRREVSWIFLFSLLLQLNVIGHYSLVAAALDIQLPFIYFCLLIPPILILTMLPISVGGLGVREVAFLFFFVPHGVTSVEILSISLLSYMLSLLASLSGGLVGSFYNAPSQ